MVIRSDQIIDTTITVTGEKKKSRLQRVIELQYILLSVSDLNRSEKKTKQKCRVDLKGTACSPRRCLIVVFFQL